MSPLRALGIDGRIVAGLLGATVFATGVGFVVAAGLDRGGATVAIAAPAPTVSPDATEPDPLVNPPLPPVVVDPPAEPQPSNPPPAVPPPAQPPPTVTEPPDAPVAPTPTPSTPTKPAPTPTTPSPTTPPAAPARPTRPTDDEADPTPFRPAPATQPLKQFIVPDSEFPADATSAAASLRGSLANAPATGTTRADIQRVLSLAERFAGTRFPGRKATVDRIVRLNAWWYARRRAPSERVLVRDPAGMIYSYAARKGFAFNPVGTAGRWQRMNEGFSAAQLATTLLELGVADARAGRATLNWEYYDVADEPNAIRPGVSGMAQARIAHLLASAFQQTGDTRFSSASAEAMASLAVPVDVGGTRALVAYPRSGTPHPWFVERAYPNADPWKGAALNGFMVAILELRAAERALRAPQSGPSAAGDAAANEARRLADEGAASLQQLLGAHDSGDWSYYGLLTPGYAFRTYLANATYHCFHVTLLNGLANGYPSANFGATAEKWAAYAARAGVSCPTTAPVG